MKFIYPEGATPLDQDEAQALIPSHITSQDELNEWESHNIERAVAVLFSRKRTDILTGEFVREIHRRMFDETWEWAGVFRKTDKNIGVSAEQVGVGVHTLLDDVNFWLSDAVYSIEEIAVRLHHRMVMIHPFVNGNGRHARLLADTLLFNRNRPRIRWGGENLDSPGRARSTYISALRAADQGDYGPLLAFAGCVV